MAAEALFRVGLTHRLHQVIDRASRHKPAVFTRDDQFRDTRDVGADHRSTERQRQTVKGLGLRRIHHSVELQDTPEIRGMLRKVLHFVEVIEG